MKIAVVAPSPVPFTRGGAERALWGIQAAINDLTHHEAEMIKIPVEESTLPSVIAAYELFSQLDLSHFDRIITTKYPAWMVEHPHKTILMMHVLRGVYDTYHLHHRPLTVEHPDDHTFAMLHLMRTNPGNRGALAEFFERWHNALAALGPDHPDFTFPGPFARLAIRWLDGIGMDPGEVAQYLSQSKTVARREGYFPTSVSPRVVNLPGKLPLAPVNDEHGTYLFTASRLDGPKRLDLLIDAMAHVPGELELRIAGTGALRSALEEQAAGDPRIRFLGFTRNDQLPELYRNALAVPFIPYDEDLGLITLEAFSQHTAVVTVTDAGGPTEFVKDGATGLVAEPNPASLGSALARLVADPDLAAELGAAGFERGERITWEEVVEALLGDERFTPEEQAARTAAAIAADAERPRSARRVAVVTTFAINDPGHGGQLRARNLYGELSRRRPVEVVALVDPDQPAGRLGLDEDLVQVTVPRSREHQQAIEELSRAVQLPVSDLVAGTEIAQTPAYLDALRTAVDGASAVILAEPYLLPAVEALGLDVPVVYDAYNVEAQLKADAYPDTDVGRELLAQVEEVERRAVATATHVTACSATDVAALTAAGGRSAADATVIPNGTTVPDEVATPGERRAASERWRQRYWSTGSLAARPEHLAVFFGSWHPPNLDAVELLAEIAPELPDVLLLSVGHHGQAFLHRLTPPNLVFTGMVSTRAKDLLLRSADVALNPMRQGSGTNLKLLEYLAVGVPVVSTPFGARGIDVVDGEHLLLAEPEGFAAAVRSALDDPDAAARRAEAGRALVADRYGWEALGRRLAGVIDDLVAARAPR